MFIADLLDTIMQVAAGSVQKAVIVETKKEFARADGSTLRFDRNACVLVSDKGEPLQKPIPAVACCSFPLVARRRQQPACCNWY